MSETPRPTERDRLLALARDIGTVLDVAARRSDPDADHRAMLVRLRQWRDVLLSATPPEPLAACGECPLLDEVDRENLVNPHTASCGEKFNTYEEWQQHERKHVAALAGVPQEKG